MRKPSAKAASMLHSVQASPANHPADHSVDSTVASNPIMMSEFQRELLSLRQQVSDLKKNSASIQAPSLSVAHTQLTPYSLSPDLPGLSSPASMSFPALPPVVSSSSGQTPAFPSPTSPLSYSCQPSCTAVPLAGGTLDHSRANFPHTTSSICMPSTSAPSHPSPSTGMGSGLPCHPGHNSHCPPLVEELLAARDSDSDSDTGVRPAMDHMRPPTVVDLPQSWGQEGGTLRCPEFLQQQYQVQGREGLPPPPAGSNFEPVTPICPERLFCLLRGSPAALHLYEGFKFGFRVPHLSSPWKHPIRNHKSAFAHSSFLDEYIAKELRAGRIVGPFDVLPEHCIISPLGLVPKQEPGSFRVIHDLSYPKGRGVNDLIPNHLTSVTYEDFDHVVGLIRQAGRGALIAKVDIQNAFRIMPIHCEDIHLFGFSWREKFYLDKCLPMGCSISCALFEQFSSALQHVNVSGLGNKGITPHSFRIGAATSAAALGIPDDAIQRMGRWSSRAFLRYIKFHVNRI